MLGNVRQWGIWLFTLYSSTYDFNVFFYYYYLQVGFIRIQVRCMVEVEKNNHAS